MTDFALGALPPDRIDALIAKLTANPLGESADSPSDSVYVWSGKSLAAGFDMREHCSAVEDQLQWGTCTANTTVGASELFLKRAGQFEPDRDELSRDFNYWWAGVLDGWQGKDVGRTVRNALRAAQIYGLCRESTEPYSAEGITQPPPPAAIVEGAQHRLTKFARIAGDPLTEVKQALNDGFPVSMAFRVHRWVFNITGPLETHWRQPGALAAKDPLNDVVGNHDVLVVGYQDSTDPSGGYFIVRNSWSPEWGDGGYWAMPYDRIGDAYEFWAVESFNGLDVAPVAPPLSSSEVEATRQRMLRLGLSHINAHGEYLFGPSGMEMYGAATIALLKHEGKTFRQMAQIGGIDESAIATFASSNAAMVAAWEGALR